MKTGFKTKNILCQPLRGQRGGGHIIGVIQMLNKEGGFDASDEEHMATCVQRVADDMHAQFKELVGIADHMIANSIFVGDKGGHVAALDRHKFDDSTSASINQRTSKDEHKKFAEPYFKTYVKANVTD